MLLVVNLDSVGAGDYLFVYGGKYQGTSLKQVWGYNMARDVAMRMGIDLRQMPIQVERYQSPTRSDASDQVWFYRNDIPYVYFEANAWVNDAGEVPFPDKPYNYNSRKNEFKSTDGRIIHTVFDDMDKLEELIPGVQMNHMRETSTIISQMIREMNLDTPAVYETIYEGQVYTATGWVTYNHGVVTGGNPPPTEPPVTQAPVTEPPATEPPATEPPVTDAPATDPGESRIPDETPKGGESADPSGIVPDSSAAPVTKTEPGRETKAPDKPGGNEKGEPGKKNKGNALAFWLVEGTILLLIAGCAAYLILTSKEMKRRRRRRGKKKSAGRR